MKIFTSLLFVFLGFSFFAQSQVCYEQLGLTYNSTKIASVGDFYWYDNMEGPMLVVDKDDLISSSDTLKVCGDWKVSRCQNLWFVDETIEEIKGFLYTSDNVVRCQDEAFFYIDVIDTKFTWKYLNKCSGIMVYNKSNPVSDPVTKVDPSNPPSFYYLRSLEEIQSYEFVLKNLSTNQVAVYPSVAGDSLLLPSGNYSVELKISGIDGKLNQVNNIYANELTKTITKKGCGSIILYNTTYTKSGTYKQTIKNASSCDSVITLNLTILRPSIATVNKIACGSFAFNGKTYTTSGIYKHVLTNKAGCDSTITLNLTVNQPSNTTLNKISCEDTYSFNGKIYTTGGTYTHKLLNKAGCDSTITLNLSFVKVNTEVVLSDNVNLTAQEVNADYKWYDCDAPNTSLAASTSKTYTALKSGKYAVKLTKSGCLGNSICTTVKNLVGLNLDFQFANSLSIFPNPTKGEVLLNFQNVEEEISVLVISLTGKEIFKENICHINLINIDLTEQPSGIYFLIVQKKDGRSKYFEVKKE